MSTPDDPIEGLVGAFSVGGTFIGHLLGVTIRGRRLTQQIRNIGNIEADKILVGKVDFDGDSRKAFICGDFLTLFRENVAHGNDFRGTFYPRGLLGCGTIWGNLVFKRWRLENWDAESEAAKIEEIEFDLYNVTMVSVLTKELWFEVTSPDGSIGTHPAVILTDGADVTVYAQIYIPFDFTALTSAYIIIVAGGTGNLRRSVSSNFGVLCGAENYNNHTDSIAVGQVAVTASRLTCIDISAALTGLGASDLVGLTFTRAASDVNDTVNADCYYLGIRVRYT